MVDTTHNCYGKDQAVNRCMLALHTACQGKKPVTILPIKDSDAAKIGTTTIISS